MWPHPRTPDRDQSGDVVNAAQRYAGAGSPTPCHKQFPPRCGTGQGSLQPAVAKVMANGNPISLESMFWEQPSPSKSLVKETKQTLLQIQAVKCIAASSRRSRGADTARRRSPGWHRPLRAAGRAEERGASGASGTAALPCRLPQSPAAPAATARGAPGDSHGP